jgi:hypothetical protein
MRRRPIVRVLLMVSLLAGTTGCGDDETTPTEPTDPDRQTFTETFGESLTVNGAHTHAFAANGSGEIRATLSALGPNNEVRIGLSLGTFNASGACQIVIANDNATQGTIVIGNAGAAGSFCVRVYDVGQLSETATYTVTVVHF